MSDPDPHLPEVPPAPDEEQVKQIEQTPLDVLDDDGGLPQPSQDPNEVIGSDEEAEG